MVKLKNEDLWESYKVRKDESAKEALILEYAPLVKYVAGRLAVGLTAKVELDDLIGFGIFGLIDAIEKFDHARGIKFETYALARIRGSIIDGLRAMDWVPQSVRQKAREIEKTYTRLENELGRSVSDLEVSQALGISLDEFHQLLGEVSYTSLLYLEDLWLGEGADSDSVRVIEMISDPNVEDPTLRLEFEETKQLLAEAIDKLPEKERIVISLYYYDGLTLKEIGAVLGLSESRISQLHTKAILRLRGRLSRQKKKIFGI